MKDLSQLFMPQPLAQDLYMKFIKDTERKEKIQSKKAKSAPIPKPELPKVVEVQVVPVQTQVPVPVPVPTPESVPVPAPVPEPAPVPQASKPKMPPIYQQPKMPIRSQFKGFDVPVRVLY